ncbi:MAG: 30S ribosomal protein S20 [Anaerolineales bacterium]|nr:MAG: 30S ribosomal protein S20 [Euryarchaeota archaeon]
MANIKSQIKRNRQNEDRRLRNRNMRGAARTAVNQARAAFEANEPETKEAILKAISALDKAAEKGVIHKNNAARRKGRLMKKLALFGQGVAAPEAKPARKKKSSK